MSGNEQSWRRSAEDERKRKPAETDKKLPTVSLTLVSFAVTRKAYERITARFAQQYEAERGRPCASASASAAAAPRCA